MMPEDTRSNTQLSQLIGASNPCLLTPTAFMISWNGVLVLAFDGWPEAITGFKKRFEQEHPSLEKEKSGSKWPKTTVGCLKEDVTLTESQFNELNVLCKAFSTEVFHARNTEAGIAIPVPRICLDTLTISVYENRCMERVLSSQAIILGGQLDESEPSGEEKERVRGIVAEPDDPEYYHAVSKPGSRESHYRGPNIGVTLAHSLGMHLENDVDATKKSHAHVRPALQHRGATELKDRKALLDCIQEFRQRVDRLLPGAYAWFDNNSLHITVRAIIA